MLFLCPHPSVAEVQRSVCGKGRCIHTRLTLKMLSQLLPDYHNNIIIIIIIIICIIIILINSFQRSVKNKFSLILLPCDAMRWPFRVICMPLCRARALWLLLLLLWCCCWELLLLLLGAAAAVPCLALATFTRFARCLTV